MKQGKIISLLKNKEENQISVIISIYRKKLIKLFFQNFIFYNNFSFSIYNRKLILRFTNFGGALKFISFFQLFNLNKRFKLKIKKKQILNLGNFKIDILEEKTLIKEESKPRTTKRGKKYKFKNYNFDLSPLQKKYKYLFLKKKTNSKNYFLLGAILPNSNFVSNRFLLNIFFKYFKQYRKSLQKSLFLSQQKNFINFLHLLSIIQINIRLNYFFIFLFNANYSSSIFTR